MELLKHLYKFDAKSRHEDEFAIEVMYLLKERGADVSTDKKGNVYAVKGVADTYPCIVAHLDEVHEPRSKKFEIVVTEGGIIKGYDSIKKKWRHGIGADDKNGIWVALKCLESFDAVKVAFFVGEEIGCTGSNEADIEFFKNCRFVLQCDRRGSSDLITNISGIELCSKDFLKAVNCEDWGFQEEHGMLTDVMTLKRKGLEVSCVNMSCGYYNPHTPYEYTDFAELEKCLRFVQHIVRDCVQVYKHKYEPKTYGYGCYSGYRGRGWSAWDDDDNWFRTPSTKDKSPIEQKPEPKDKPEEKPKVQEKVEEVEENDVYDISWLDDEGRSLACDLYNDGLSEAEIEDALIGCGYGFSKEQMKDLMDALREEFGDINYAVDDDEEEVFDIDTALSLHADAKTYLERGFTPEQTVKELQNLYTEVELARIQAVVLGEIKDVAKAKDEKKVAVPA